MRILMWFTIGFAVACAVGVYLVADMFLLLLAGIAFVAAIPLLFLRSPLSKITSVILIGFAIGSVWTWGFDCIYLKPAKAYDSQQVSGTVLVSDYSYDTKFGVAADARMRIEGKNYKVRVYVTDEKELAPGDTVTGVFKIRLTTPDSDQGATYHPGKGIFILAYADEGAQVEKADKVPLNFFAASLRRKITDLLDRAFPEDTRGFARALLLGDSSLLTYEEDTAFKISGIRHVIAVSGLHISILFAFVLMISTNRGLPAMLIGYPVLFLFAAVAGFTPSVVRACVMQALMVLSLIFNKEYDPPTALAFAVMVMLGINPMTITSVSFQLSVGCLIGIFLFYQRLYDYFTSLIQFKKPKGHFARWVKWIFASVSVTLSAMSVTTPLCAIYFGTVSIVGILTNLLALWVVSFIFYGIMLTCVLGLIWQAGAGIIAWLISWPMRYVLRVSEFLSGFSWSAVYTCSIYIVVWLVFSYVMLAVFFLGRRKHPVVATGCILFGLIVALTASWLEPSLSNYRFTVLDVGQGQCLLWQCDGKAYMVDCGGDSPESTADIAAQTLLSQGITKLDGLILTHYDDDHAGAAQYLLSRINADKLYLPDTEDDGEIRKMLEDSYSDRIHWVDRPIGMRTDAMQLILYTSSSKKSGNESCLCVLFQTEECDILVTGDRGFSGEKDLLKLTKLPELDVLVAGHHGSKNATSLELLHATKPKTVVISVGENNSYGHPADELLRRLKQFGCSIWRTDLDKTITIKG